MSSQEAPVDDDSERFTETTTESVEMGYNGGDVQYVTITAMWRKGIRAKDTSLRDGYIDDQITGVVRYRVNEGTAELWGFYPDTNVTGERLYHKTLKAIRVLNHASEEVQQRLSDEITVEQPKFALLNELQQ